MIAGCTGALRGGVLYLTLDTRGSSVNVFTPAVALELERELEAGLAAGARAVVLQSAKPGSFVNGVGLLLAASSHAQGAAMERAHILRRCYERLAAAPVPTIAAIEGNCYGCGLELALACDYRIARDSYDTHFYMPELRDYAFVPLFGATQRLPRLLGLRRAMEVLLGERLDARRAARIGLIDRLAPAQGVAATLRSLLSTLRARHWPKRPPALRKLARLLVQRRLPGIEVKARGSIAFSTRKVPGALTCTLGGPRTEADCAAFLPLAGGAAIELVPGAPERPWRRGAALFQVLEQAGFQPIVTSARGRFVSERLFAAFASAIASRPARASLLGFGYRLPAAVRRRVRAGASKGIAEHLSAALAQECIRALDEGELTHPSQADLLVDVLFGFPVVRGGLLRYVASGTSRVASDAG